jgi:hypothetical protein
MIGSQVLLLVHFKEEFSSFRRSRSSTLVPKVIVGNRGASPSREWQLNKYRLAQSIPSLKFGDFDISSSFQEAKE